MKYKITGTVMQTANLELKTGEKVYSESGNMAWMSENISLDTSTKGGVWKGIKRKLSGDTFFMNTFTCESGTGIITFASEYPGKVLPIKLSGNKEYICQKDSFMCAEEGIDLDIHFKKRLGTGFFGGEGFILQKISGKGTAFVEISGEVTEINLKKDQVLKVSTGHIAMFEPTVDFDISFIGGVKNVFFGGEGLFLSTLKGPGKVWLQSMPINKLARKIGSYLTNTSSKRGFRTFINNPGE